MRSAQPTQSAGARLGAVTLPPGSKLGMQVVTVVPGQGGRFPSVLPLTLQHALLVLLCSGLSRVLFQNQYPDSLQRIL